MIDAHGAVDAAIEQVNRLRRRLKTGTTLQVRATDERALIKATCLTWFNNQREFVLKRLDEELLRDIDGQYKWLLSASDRSTSRKLYDSNLKTLQSYLSGIRADTIQSSSVDTQATSDIPPDFTKLASDSAMRNILAQRWTECAICVAAGAPLAATVMMGGLLETLLLARVNQETDKSVVFGAARAPKDKTTGKAQPLQEWTLRHYIDVAHEIHWISTSAKDVGEVVRDYRNYVHPYKQLSHGMELRDGDAQLFWEISKNIARQLLL